MKKILGTVGLIIIAAALAVTFAACGGNDNYDKNGNLSNGNNGDIANVGDSSEKQTSNEDLPDWDENDEIIFPEIDG